jgi:hypothetical protein
MSGGAPGLRFLSVRESLFGQRGHGRDAHGPLGLDAVQTLMLGLAMGKRPARYDQPVDVVGRERFLPG